MSARIPSKMLAFVCLRPLSLVMYVGLTIYANVGSHFLNIFFFPTVLCIVINPLFCLLSSKSFQLIRDFKYK